MKRAFSSNKLLLGTVRAPPEKSTANLSLPQKMFF